jgi:PAS domain S-box-containing protein
VVVHDASTGAVLDVNQRALAVFRCSAEDLRRRGAEAFCTEGPPYSAADAEARVRLAMAGQEQLFEWMTRRPDGTEFWMEVRLTRSTVGASEYVLGLVRDISERKRSEQAIRELDRRFRRLLEDVRMVAVLLDMDGRVTFANDYLVAITGREREELLNQPFVDLVAERFRAEVGMHMAAMLESGVAGESGETELWTVSGKPRWVQWHDTVLRDSTGARVGLARLGVDTTERRALEEQYLQSQKLESLGRLAGGVAHDFNNLLTVINGFASLLQFSVEPGSSMATGLQEILDAGERATTLVQQLLAFSRRQVSQPRTLDLNEVVREAGSMLRRLLSENVELVLELTPEPMPVVADPGQLHQVLLNLAVNARDAMPGGGRLTLGTECWKGPGKAMAGQPEIPGGIYARLVVCDTGCGIDEQLAPHIFDPFFTTKPPGQGTGLGLSTVFGIVSQSKGWIWFESVRGQGTRFLVCLPLARAENGEPGRGRDQAAIETGVETLLVVEDQDQVRKIAVAILRSCGYHTLVAADAEEALEVARAYAAPIDLLLTDMVMPGMGGRELAAELVRQRPGLRVLFTSGYSTEMPGVGRGGLGAAFLPKPYTAAELAAKVREVLGAPC